MSKTIDTRRNKTTSFMLPALGFSSDKTSFKLLQYFGFVNCYLDHLEYPIKHKNSLYLVFKPDKDAVKRFGDFYEIYKTYSNFVEDYVLDTNLIVVVFRILPKWIPSFEAFKESNYSKMSTEYAVLFKRPDLISGKVFLTPEYSIITKNPHYKSKLEDSLSNPTSPVVIPDELELLDKLDMKQETFSYNPNSEDELKRILPEEQGKDSSISEAEKI